MSLRRAFPFTPDRRPTPAKKTPPVLASDTHQSRQESTSMSSTTSTHNPDTSVVGLASAYHFGRTDQRWHTGGVALFLSPMLSYTVWLAAVRDRVATDPAFAPDDFAALYDALLAEVAR